MEVLAPWHWRSQPLVNRSGTEVFAALFQHQRIATLLESPATDGEVCLAHSRYSICAGSPREKNGHPQIWTPQMGGIFDCLGDRLQAGATLLPTSGPAHLPFIGGWLGWLGYDCAWEIETLPWLRSDSLPFPVTFWYEPEAFAVLDHQQQELWLAASTPQSLDQLEIQLKHPSKTSHFDPREAHCNPLTMILTQPEFEDRVRTAKDHIQAGDIFQTNLSLRFQTTGTLHPWTLYQILQQINPSPFASYWQTPWGCVVSCSPERLVQLHDGIAQIRPIAGTRPRGNTPESDQNYLEALKSNPKERAEHIMLVDLERNDLGKVCEWGTVQVDEFLTVERYSHVMHLVSNVIGHLCAEVSAIDLIRAVFPGGTITGCPKVRCMEIIETLEPVRRNLFYGSCGYLDVRGNLDLNILIRTLLIAGQNSTTRSWHLPTLHPVQIWGQVGAGIVADSDPTQEWLESLQKAQAQWIALQRISTQVERSFDFESTP
jgi:para-aminobenzoate synthetase component I